MPLEKLLIILNQYKCVAISAWFYCILSDNKQKHYCIGFQPSYLRIELQTGLYARVYDDELIFVSKKLIPLSDENKFKIRVSNKINIDGKTIDGWSPLFELEDFEKFNKFKAFW